MPLAANSMRSYEATVHLPELFEDARSFDNAWLDDQMFGPRGRR
jgi:hypothetical protein